MDDDAVMHRTLDGAFTVFVMQRGPIQSTAVLLEFLTGVAPSIGPLPESVLTPQHLAACGDLWHESWDTPLHRDSCKQIVQRLHEISQMVLIEPEDAERIFAALAHTAEFLPSCVLLHVLEGLVDAGDPSMDTQLEAFAAEELVDDTLTCPMLLELCDVYLWLSHLLATSATLICDAAAALDDDIEPIGYTDPSTIERLRCVQQAIEVGRKEHAAERLASRRDADATMSRGRQPPSSVFYPQPLVATDGTGGTMESLLANVRMHARSPLDALRQTAQLMAPQTLVRRVSDLRKASAAQEAKRQAAIRADIVHAVYDATDLAPVDAPRGSKPNILRPLDIEGLGERAGRRLHPHEQPPIASMYNKLLTTLGVAVEAPLARAPKTSLEENISQKMIQRKLTSLRQRKFEERYLHRRRTLGVDSDKKAVQDAAGFFSPTFPRKTIPNFDRPMASFFALHPKQTPSKRLPAVASAQKSRGASRSCSSLHGEEERAPATDLHHELQIVLTDAVDALTRSMQQSQASA